MFKMTKVEYNDDTGFDAFLMNALNCKVKIKLETGELFQFNPYYTVGSSNIYNTECKIDWVHSRKTLYIYEVRDMIERLGVETNNITDLCRCKYNTSKLKLNMHL
jgi:hypothetical protein